MPWDSIYRPETFKEIVGNDSQLDKLSRWAKKWTEHKQAIVLHGPPGVGKTTSSLVLAQEKNWEIIEMNASDKRTGKIIDKIAGESSQTASLTGKKRKLIILDEADNLHGNSDRGGKKAISKTIKKSKQPIILIANDYYDLTRTLRNSTKEIEFESIDKTVIAKRLRDICEDNSITYDIPSLQKIAENSDGDLRAAINDLQRNAVGKDKLKITDINVNKRDKKAEIFPFLDYLLKEGNAEEAQEKTIQIDMTPEELFRWIDENIYREYTGSEIVNGLDNLSKADIWLSRTRKTQNYKYWKYATGELSAGVSSARENIHSGWTRWQPPKWRNKNRISEDLVQKIATESNCSIQTVRNEVIPFLENLVPYCKPKNLTIEMAAWYNLTESELSEITGSGKNTNKVQDIISDAEKIRNEFDIHKKQINNTDKQNKINTSTDKEKTDNSTDSDSDTDEDNQSGLTDFI